MLVCAPLMFPPPVHLFALRRHVLSARGAMPLQHPTACPPGMQELAPYKLKRVWEQHAVDRYWRWRRHGFRDAMVVLRPKARVWMWRGSGMGMTGGDACAAVAVFSSSI